MKELLAFILVLLLPISAMPQKCKCPDEGFAQGLQPIKIFSFSNHKQIGLCGYVDDSTIKDSYEEFSIFECGQSKPIQEWGALPPCKVTQKQDTLIVGEFGYIYIGTKFNSVKTPFFIHKFYYSGSELRHLSYYRKDIKKYSHKQITEVINKYHHLKQGNSEYTVEVANMLFWGYVSGSKQCEVYLNTIEKKFGPFDGAIAEEWEDAIATYQHWKQLNQK